MRILLIPVMLLALSGCATTQGGGGSTQVADTIAVVQTEVQRVCSFVPTAQTVSNILAALGVPYVGMATDIASQICAAVTRPAARAKRTAPTIVVRGRLVPVYGNFVR